MKLLVATDGSSCAENAIRFASRLAKESHSAVTLLYVIPMVDATNEGVITLLKEEMGSPAEAGTKYLETGRKIVEEFGIKTETKFLEGDPVDEILKEADRHDLVVVGSHGKGKVNKFLLGSVSSKLIHKSKVPVLVVR